MTGKISFRMDAGHVPLFRSADWPFGVDRLRGVTACSMVGAIIGGRWWLIRIRWAASRDDRSLLLARGGAAWAFALPFRCWCWRFLLHSCAGRVGRDSGAFVGALAGSGARLSAGSGISAACSFELRVM